MRRKDVKRLFRLNPDFESWLLKDSMRAIEVRTDPSKTKGFYRQWQMESKRKPFTFEMITEKTKKASSVLNNVQTIMEMMSEYNQKNPE